MTPAESKTIEGQRLQALFGGIAALPAAALVAKGAEGAPLFSLAILLVAGAYMFWMFTDAVFMATIVIRSGDPEFAPAYKLGLAYQTATFVYGIGSLAATAAGFAATHSKISTGISVEIGFWIVAGLGLGVAWHIWNGMQSRNQLTLTAMGVRARKDAAE